MTPALPQPLVQHLHRFLRQRRAASMLAAAGWAMAIALAWMTLCLLADRWLHFGPATRGALMLLAVGFVVATLARPFWHWLRHPVDWRQVAAAMESRDPAMAERLQTLVSQALLPPQQRGSEQFLAAIWRQACEQLDASRRTRRIPARPVVRAWAAAAGAAAVIGLLSLAPTLDLGLLVDRFIRPWADLPPATTTTITLEEQDIQVVQGQSLNIRATARRTRGADVQFKASSDGESWTTSTMLAVGTESYVFSLPSVERDTLYFVSANDARTPTRRITVLRRPAVAELRTRLQFPAYLGRPTEDVVLTEGQLDVPAGTEMTLTLRPTEPLKSATAYLSGAKVDMKTGPALTWIATTTVRRDQFIEIEMLGDSGLVGHSGSPIAVRVVPDARPVVALSSGPPDLCVAWDRSVALGYTASDDLAIASIQLQIRVNEKPPRAFSLPTPRDVRAVDGDCEVELPALNAQVGDVLTLWIGVADKAGQRASSEPRQFLVGPSEVALRPAGRVELITRAAAGASMMLQQLRTAANLTSPTQEPDTSQQAILASRALGDVRRSAAQCIQSLLQAAADGMDSRSTDAAGRWIDIIAQAAAVADDVDASLVDETVEPAAAAQRLRLAGDQVASCARQAQSLAESQMAGLAAGLRQALAAMPASADQQAMQNVHSHFAGIVDDLWLDLDDPALDKQLQDISAHALVDGPPVQLDLASRQWALDVQQDARELNIVPRRLALAAALQAVRSDSDAQWAADLALAASAAETLASQPAADLALAAIAAETLASQPAADLTAFAEAMAQLVGARPSRDAAAFDRARTRLTAWASQRPGGRSPMELAMAANSLMRQNRPEAAASLDLQLAASVGVSATTQPASLASLAMQVRQVEGWIDEQRTIAAKTDAAAQKRLADALAQATDTARTTATSTIALPPADVAAMARRGPLPEGVVARQPLAAAAALAELAAAERAPDAAMLRERIIALLEQSRDALLRKASAIRLNTAPTLAGLLPGSDVTGQIPRPAALDWLAPTHPVRAPSPGIAPAAAEQDVPGYRNALRAYFQALGRMSAEDSRP